MPHHEMGRVNPTQISEYLQGCNFPCSKRDLVSYCNTQHCPTEIRDFLERMPDRQYFSMADVMQSVGQVE